MMMHGVGQALNLFEIPRQHANRMMFEQKLAVGSVLLRVVTPRDASVLVLGLTAGGFARPPESASSA